jgi:hypothetical protein
VNFANYVRGEIPHDFSYGQKDCATFAVNWLDAQFGLDGLALWTKNYDSAASCEAFIEQCGGMEAIADDFCLKIYGLKRAAPAAGNVVLAMINKAEVMAIRKDEIMIAARLLRGVVLTSEFEVIAEWGPLCRPS